MRATVFNLTSIFEQVEEDFDLPTLHIPGYALTSVLKVVDGYIGQQHPRNGLHALWRGGFLDKDVVAVEEASGRPWRSVRPTVPPAPVDHLWQGYELE